MSMSELRKHSPNDIYFLLQAPLEEPRAEDMPIIFASRKDQHRAVRNVLCSMGMIAWRENHHLVA
jgi:hypothetical protein